MRRPLKPFITEYKASNRRGHAPSGEAVVVERQPAAERVFTSERDRFATKAFESPTRAEPEDSYEAAMRAADALFAPRPATDDGGTTPPTPVDVDKIFAPKPQTTPSAPIVARAPEGRAPEAERLQAPERGGRILQALNEPQPPQLAALEEAHAPKRRGRKPGSKNKPRPAAPQQLSFVDDAAAEVESVAAQVHAEVSPPAIKRPRGTRVRGRPLEASEAYIEARIPAPVARMRFSWLDRKKLKPGEFWKRRLPKVCW